MSLKWFCGFSINEATPDHSYFGRIRKALGAAKISMIFEKIKEQSKSDGIMREIFTFVDATTIVAKNTTWDERDKAIKEGEDKLNNKNVDKYSADKDARFGCKGKDKFWYGYKRHTSVDMTSGLIRKVAVTPANVTDQAGLDHVCPSGGMVFADKQYCCKRAQITMKANGCHSGAILKNNMKLKDIDSVLALAAFAGACFGASPAGASEYLFRSLEKYTSAPTPRALQATEIASVRAILKHSSEVYKPFFSLATNEAPPTPGIGSLHCPSTLMNSLMVMNAATSSLPPFSRRWSTISYFQPIPHTPNVSVRAFIRHIGLMSVMPFSLPPVMSFFASGGTTFSLL